MKNKMLRTTALVGSLFVLGTSVSNAQTTITGQLDLSYRAVSNDLDSQKINNFRGFGKESQINIANKGKLSNGMDYAAGFSLEFDGNDTAVSSLNASSTVNSNAGDLSGALSGENVYIDLISGNTTFTFGADHIQNPDSHAHINPAGVGYITSYTAGVAGLYPTGANSPYNAYGVGIVQTVPGFGKVSANYVPNPTFGSSNIAGTVGPEIGNAGTLSNYDGAAESAYEVGFVGDFGVKGLTVVAFRNAETNKQDAASATNKTKGHRIGGSYNFGQITVGLDKVETTGTTGIEVGGKAASITFAATKDFSIGATYGKSDSSSASATADEKIKLISMGYNLGPVALNATIRDVENIAGKEGSGALGDSRDAIVRLSTKF
jgi:hypothetical protein